MTSPLHNSGRSTRRRRSRRSVLDFSTVQVKCSFCGNTFTAPAASAVCPKCSRPANRALKIQWRALALLAPPIGLLQALIIRSHSPIAASQGLKWSLGGLFGFGAIAVLNVLFNIV